MRGFLLPRIVSEYLPPPRGMSTTKGPMFTICFALPRAKFVVVLDVSFSPKRGATRALILSFSASCRAASSGDTTSERTSASNSVSESRIMASPSVARGCFPHTCRRCPPRPHKVRRRMPGPSQWCMRRSWPQGSDWCRNTIDSETEACRRQGP